MLERMKSLTFSNLMTQIVSDLLTRNVRQHAEVEGSRNDAHLIQAVVFSSLEVSGFCAQKKLTCLCPP
jgi:hypothetical protein